MHFRKREHKEKRKMMRLTVSNWKQVSRERIVVTSQEVQEKLWTSLRERRIPKIQLLNLLLWVKQLFQKTFVFVFFFFFSSYTLKWYVIQYLLTLYTLTSLCIFSTLFSIHFLGSNKENLWNHQRALWVADHFLYSCDLNLLFRGDSVRRN